MSLPPVLNLLRSHPTLYFFYSVLYISASISPLSPSFRGRPLLPTTTTRYALTSAHSALICAHLYSFSYLLSVLSPTLFLSSYLLILSYGGYPLLLSPSLSVSYTHLRAHETDSYLV